MAALIDGMGMFGLLGLVGVLLLLLGLLLLAVRLVRQLRCGISPGWRTATACGMLIALGLASVLTAMGWSMYSQGMPLPYLRSAPPDAPVWVPPPWVQGFLDWAEGVPEAFRVGPVAAFLEGLKQDVGGMSLGSVAGVLLVLSGGVMTLWWLLSELFGRRQGRLSEDGPSGVLSSSEPGGVEGGDEG
jgi:hypothetical protein